jgi:phage baseplate assembly protein W
MSYNLKQINVLDLRASTGIGVALPFNSSAVFQTVYTTQEQLKYNIINFLLTNKRERVFNPNFGAGIRNKVFDQISQETIDSLDVQIRAGVEAYFPNVRIVQLTFNSKPDENLLTIQFSYTIKNSGISDNITIDLNGQ